MRHEPCLHRSSRPARPTSGTVTNRHVPHERNATISTVQIVGFEHYLPLTLVVKVVLGLGAA